jgi:hypothetical protein
MSTRLPAMRRVQRQAVSIRVHGDDIVQSQNRYNGSCERCRNLSVCGVDVDIGAANRVGGQRGVKGGRYICRGAVRPDEEIIVRHRDLRKSAAGEVALHHLYLRGRRSELRDELLHGKRGSVERIARCEHASQRRLNLARVLYLQAHHKVQRGRWSHRTEERCVRQVLHRICSGCGGRPPCALTFGQIAIVNNPKTNKPLHTGSLCSSLLLLSKSAFAAARYLRDTV